MHAQRFLSLTVMGVLLLLGLRGLKVAAQQSSPSSHHPKDTAIVVMHFGTTHDGTRRATLDAITEAIVKAYPEYEVREAYTSRIIVKRLSDRGIHKASPQEVLQALHREGYKYVIIQPTMLTYGMEVESIHRDTSAVRHLFEEVRVGTPLLFFANNDGTDDYDQLLQVLTADADAGVAHVWVGHGSDEPSTAQYAMLQMKLRDRGFTNHFVGCVEGYPYLSQVKERLRASGAKRVVLHPLMMVAGDHTKNDVAVEWKAELEQEGLDVSVELRGLGEYPAIRELLIRKVTSVKTSKRLDIMAKKAIYAQTGEMMDHEHK